MTDMSYLFSTDRNSAASSFNEDISAWDTSSVTSMYRMFSYASAFNQDLGAWDTSGVTTMYSMFYRASAFDQDLTNWAVDRVTSMFWMFRRASAFDQDLGWCVDDGVNLNYAFTYTPCSSTSCGVKQVDGGCAPTPAPTSSAPTATQSPTPRPTPRPSPHPTSFPTPRPTPAPIPIPATGYVMTDSNIRTAVAAWLSDSASAEVMYGHISTWQTRGVTDMSWLFCANSGWISYGCNTAAASFNEDISAWDTSGVTSMHLMFSYASAFDQDLGWCVDDGVDFDPTGWGWTTFEETFEGTLCESTSCGVYIQGNCPTPAPSRSPAHDDDDDDDDDSWKVILGWVAGVLGFLCFLMLLPRSRPRTAAEAVERANRRSRVHVASGAYGAGTSHQPPEWR